MGGAISEIPGWSSTFVSGQVSAYRLALIPSGPDTLVDTQYFLLGWSHIFFQETISRHI